MKNALLIIIIIFFMSCSHREINGLYFDKNTTKVYEFNKNNLLIYNITDSTIISKTYSQINNSKLVFIKENKKYGVFFSLEKDSLFLLDDQQNIFIDKIKLSKINVAGINNNLIFKNYWNIKSFDNKVIFSMNFHKDGLMEIYKNNENPYLTNFKNETYFNKFSIFKLPNNIFNNDLGFLLSDISKDTLYFTDLNNNKILKFNKRISTFNTDLFNTWVNTSPKWSSVVLFNDNGERFYFGDTISFSEKLIFKRKIKNKKYYFLEDSINTSNFNNVKNNFSFQIGLDTKFLTLNKPLNKTLRIIKLNKDSLVIQIGKNRKIQYKAIN